MNVYIKKISGFEISKLWYLRVKKAFELLTRHMNYGHPQDIKNFPFSSQVFETLWREIWTSLADHLDRQNFFIQFQTFKVSWAFFISVTWHVTLHVSKFKEKRINFHLNFSFYFPIFFLPIKVFFYHHHLLFPFNLKKILLWPRQSLIKKVLENSNKKL